MSCFKITRSDYRDNLPGRRFAPFCLVLAVFGFVAPVCLGQQQTQVRFEQNGQAMGTRFQIAAYAHREDLARQAISAAAQRIDDIEQALSNYRDDSEVSLLSRYCLGTPYAVSDDLWDILQMSARLHRDTHGAFDVTLDKLTQLWREARRRKMLPEQHEIDLALSQSGFRNIRLDEPGRTICFCAPGIGLDFGGIGKGFAADEALRTLAAHGVRSAMVEIGGDIAVGDAPPQRSGWRIAIASIESGQTATRAIEVVNCGVATSGDTQQYLAVNGRRFSHLLDPRSGWAIERNCHVTVVGPSAADADAMASAVSVLDRATALALVNQINDLDVLVAELPGEVKPIEYRSGNFPEMIRIENDP